MLKKAFGGSTVLHRLQRNIKSLGLIQVSGEFIILKDTLK
jgi:hypothetical protein